MSERKIENEKVERFTVNPQIGLSSEQVEKRKLQKQVNYDTSVPTRSIKKIISDNIFTIFNLVNMVLAIAIISVQSYKNLLFLVIVICNTVISIVQEIHSKRMVDKLSILSAMEADVIRNGQKTRIKVDEIVLDDIILFQAGSQIVTDCTVLEGEIEVNESCITGEADNIYKEVGSKILSGSFVVSGTCVARVEHVGEENYVSAIASGAKKVKKVKSEIMTSLNKVIQFATVVIIPLGILLFLGQKQIPGNTFQMAIVNTVAAIIGMIPEGLVLLVSTVLAVSVIRLSKKRVLVQQLHCIETLARVDTLCLDKTGTITENEMKVDGIIPVEATEEEMKEALTAIANYSEDQNGTIDAIRKAYHTTLIGYTVTKKVPFTSLKKWSGIAFEKQGSYIMGSPEFVLGDSIVQYQAMLEEYIEDNRVIVIAHSTQSFPGKELPNDLSVMGFVLIHNKIRSDAAQTIAYFKEQGVAIKIISGDNPVTVSAVARKVGVEQADRYVDMTTLHSDLEIEAAVEQYTIFGRVTPPQKQSLIRALQKKGHTVAMTGDGVNDVLALQESDCSIAVASGSDAARNVAQLVLLDSNFSAMPSIVAEGRRTINNIGRSATLFLSKTIYATILAILFLFVTVPYPFMPIHLSLISCVTIGIPSFVLALEPNKERVTGRFLANVIKKALPSAMLVVFNIIAILIVSQILHLSSHACSILCVMVTSITGLILLKHLCTPFNIIRATLFFSMVGIFIGGVIVFRDLLSLTPITSQLLLIIAIFTITSMLLFRGFEWLVKQLFLLKRKMKIQVTLNI